MGRHPQFLGRRNRSDPDYSHRIGYARPQAVTLKDSPWKAPPKLTDGSWARALTPKAGRMDRSVCWGSRHLERHSSLPSCCRVKFRV